ncbi:FG-GAP repeat domain-containing protein [Aureliella helgolandensis]|uniref:FG-GAP repeat protein n=1 Tax=Aureliella helgolandensis TaxID=2527968 RepID=A0A518G2K7_9BACT|nr:VCBS repeat-containing protein [Aureliella helgolandensis]QDV22822.1 FG-GAP repeat protein [Aureliella helgolandensis]
MHFLNPFPLHARRLHLLLAATISLQALSSLGLVQESIAQDVTFERIQLSDQFYSEGGTLGDYNGDGNGDVAVGPWIYWGPTFTSKSRFYEGEAIDPIGYSENFLMYSGDVNEDQQLDILVIGFPGKESWWFENPGKEKLQEASVLWQRHTMLESVDNESPLIADIDGDGIDDLICNSGGKMVYGSHAGQTPTALWKMTEISPERGYQRFTHGIGIGDVNNDGHQDALEKDGWWQNPGNAAPAGDHWTFHPFAFSDGGAQMFAVDLDGDGKNEVLTGTAAHGFGLAYFKSTNDEATEFEKVDIMTDQAATSPVGLAVSQLHAMALADMNGDGIVDIITGKRWWAHANGDPGSSQPATLLWLETVRQGERVHFVPHVVDNSSGVGTQITVGDVNGDGLEDIVSGIKRGAYLFLQRPADLDAHQFLVPEQAELDAFGSHPAWQVVKVGDALAPAQGDRPLNFGFESGDLQDWEARGPIASAAIQENAASSPDAAERGKYSLDTSTDAPRGIGEVISRPFLLDGERVSCWIRGPKDPEARFELISEGSGQILCSSGGGEADQWASISFDVAQWKGELVRIRVVDHSEQASIGFDEFRIHP